MTAAIKEHFEKPTCRVGNLHTHFDHHILLLILLFARGTIKDKKWCDYEFSNFADRPFICLYKSQLVGISLDHVI